MTGRILDPTSADRLAKILGLLGSVHDGERAAAGAKAHQLICSLGLTWHDVISPPTVPAPVRIRSWRSSNTDWQRMAAFCHARRDWLSQRDRDFIRSMLNWRGEPSEKQQDWLASMYARMCREAAA